jgi:hypothetical protein
MESEIEQLTNEFNNLKVDEIKTMIANLRVKYTVNLTIKIFILFINALVKKMVELETAGNSLSKIVSACVNSLAKIESSGSDDKKKINDSRLQVKLLLKKMSPNQIVGVFKDLQEFMNVIDAAKAVRK